MSRADDARREKKELDQFNESLFMEILSEKAPLGSPIGKPKGFKRAYPVLFKTILESAIEFNTRKTN